MFPGGPFLLSVGVTLWYSCYGNNGADLLMDRGPILNLMLVTTVCACTYIHAVHTLLVITLLPVVGDSALGTLDVGWLLTKLTEYFDTLGSG